MSKKIFSLKSQWSSQKKYRQDLSSAVVGSFLLDILPKNYRKIVSSSSLYSEHLLWGHFIQRTQFWGSLGQHQAIDEMKKYSQTKSLHLTFFFLFWLKIWIKKTSFWLVKRMRYLKKSVLYFLGHVPCGYHGSSAIVLSCLRGYFACRFYSYFIH